MPCFLTFFIIVIKTAKQSPSAFTGLFAAGALSFPAEYFSRPGFYRLELHITGTGWNGAHMNRVILVTEPTQQGFCFIPVTSILSSTLFSRKHPAANPPG